MQKLAERSAVGRGLTPRRKQWSGNVGSSGAQQAERHGILQIVPDHAANPNGMF
jgi:hypothetical protein